MRLRSAVSGLAAAVGTGVSLMEAGYRLPLSFQSTTLPTLTKTRSTSSWSHDHYCMDPARATVLDTWNVEQRLDDGGSSILNDDISASLQMCFSLSWNASHPLSLTSAKTIHGVSLVDRDVGNYHDGRSTLFYSTSRSTELVNEYGHSHLPHFTVTEAGIVYITDFSSSHSSHSTSSCPASQSPTETPRLHYFDTAFDAAQDPIDFPGPSVLRVRITLELQWQWQNFQVLVGQWLNRIGSAIDTASSATTAKDRSSSSQSVPVATTTTRTTKKRSTITSLGSSSSSSSRSKQRLSSRHMMARTPENSSWTTVDDTTTVSIEIDPTQVLLFLQRHLAPIYALHCSVWGVIGLHPTNLESFTALVGKAPKITDLNNFFVSLFSTSLSFFAPHADSSSSSPVDTFSHELTATCAAPPITTCSIPSSFTTNARKPTRQSSTGSLLETLKSWAYDPRVKCSASDTGLVLCLGSLLGISVLMGVLLMPEDGDD